MRQFLADGGPTIGMHPIGQRAKQMPYVAIWLIQATLFELLHHHSALHVETLLAECQFEHAVGLQPEGCLYVRFGNGQVVVGYVVVRPRVVLATGQLQRRVVIGNMYRTAEHQMLEQVGKARMFGVLVAGTYVVDDVQRNHLRAGIFVVHQPQTVVQCFFINLQGESPS